MTISPKVLEFTGCTLLVRTLCIKTLLAASHHMPGGIR